MQKIFLEEILFTGGFYLENTEEKKLISLNVQNWTQVLQPISLMTFATHCLQGFLCVSIKIVL